MHPQEIPFSRRQALATAGVVAAGTLAACSTYGKESSDTASTPASAAPPASGGAGAPGNAIAATADIPVGSGKIIDEVVVTQPTDGNFRAFTRICPHQGCKVNEVVDATIVCPCHGSEFNLDGAVVKGPATTGLAPVAIAIDGESIVPA